MTSTTTTQQTSTGDVAPSRPDDPTAADAVLRSAAAVKYAQLRDLPDVDDDPVVAAQRTALLQTLTEIAAAQERAATGTFGLCIRCGDEIAPGRLEFRPWAAACVACADR